MTDPLAERIRMIGPGRTERATETDAGGSERSIGRRGTVRARDAEESDANLLVVIKKEKKDMRAAARVADESNDPGTVDLFSKIVQIHEKHEWFIREVLKRKDGLAS